MRGLCNGPHFETHDLTSSRPFWFHEAQRLFSKPCVSEMDSSDHCEQFQLFRSRSEALLECNYWFTFWNAGPYCLCNGPHSEPRDLTSISKPMKSQHHFLGRTSQKWIAMITANIYSYSDRAQRHYCAFQGAITGLHFETRALQWSILWTVWLDILQTISIPMKSFSKTRLSEMDSSDHCEH
jgi:hypothetical protein